MSIAGLHYGQCLTFRSQGFYLETFRPLHLTLRRSAVDALAARTAAMNADVIAGIESSGFIFGVPLAQKLGLPFVPIRKPG